jgi:hypothetical protein
VYRKIFEKTTLYETILLSFELCAYYLKNLYFNYVIIVENKSFFITWCTNLMISYEQPLKFTCVHWENAPVTLIPWIGGH